jgi:circadian clock protein KaiB
MNYGAGIINVSNEMATKNEDTWVFRLFISGNSPKNDRAVSMLEHICLKHLDGKCDIKVVDISQDRLTGMEENILATPTLIKKFPEPSQRFIGDFSDEEKLLLRLPIAVKQ